ncbi:translation initiation factor IF-2 [Streptomyces sp. DvalAA-14]|nr:translation initiation factor IF-2 [Streptomyces sp. DvalAA-14]
MPPGIRALAVMPSAAQRRDASTPNRSSGPPGSPPTGRPPAPRTGPRSGGPAPGRAERYATPSQVSRPKLPLISEAIVSWLTRKPSS